MVKRRNAPIRGFDFGTDEEYGNEGLRPAGMAGFNYGSGMQAAHDILEHFPKDQGYITDEFQALGAMIWVRGTEYYAQKRRNNQTVEANLSSDMLMLFNYMRGEQYPKGPLDTPPKSRPVEDFDTDLFLQECFSLKKHDVEEEDHGRFETFCKKSIPWIEKGYWRAKKRYAQVPQWQLLQVFLDIEKVVDKVIEAIKGNEGVAVKLDYNLKTGGVVAKVPELHEEFYP